jgi:hypothetical protein
MKETLLLTSVLALGSASLSPASEAIWKYRRDMPTERTWVSGCVLDGKIYVAGGSPDQSYSTSAVEMYDPVSDSWSKKSNMPAGRSAHGMCALDGKIYVFGGISSNVYSDATKAVYVYDPQNDTWSQKGDMPFENAFFGISVVEGVIYLVGGSRSISSPPIAAVLAYDPASESWTQKADMPTARLLLSASVVDGRIYAIGGSRENWTAFCYKHTEVYDPLTDTWSRKSDMPTARASLASCVVDGKIYATGGYLPNRACTVNEVYNPPEDTWTTNFPMQQKRLGHFAGSIGYKIYAVGGSYPNPQPTHISTVEEYDTRLAVRSPDFNGDGIVDGLDVCILVEHWQSDYRPCDIAPLPFGDGVVDVQDLIALSEYLFEELKDPTLTGHWALDETEGEAAYDSAGVSDGSVMGGPVWQPSGGMVDGAIELDGVDDCVVVETQPDVAASTFSVLVWVKGGAPGQVVLSQADGANWLSAGTSEGNLMTELKGSGRGGGPLRSQISITDGEWHRVGLVWDGSNRALYVDGTVAAKDTQDGLVSSNSGLYIGCDKNMEAGTFWSGLVDDVRIYTRAVRP